MLDKNSRLKTDKSIIGGAGSYSVGDGCTLTAAMGAAVGRARLSGPTCGLVSHDQSLHKATVTVEKQPTCS